jgi:glycyl-tRNA synthetase
LVECKSCRGRFRADHIDIKGACPTCGKRDTLGEPRKFNLMFTTHIGPVEETASTIYLRPETAQGIFVNFKNVVSSSRVKVPFGIAQVGKAFRNEIVTKAFIFRTAEFEQMEMQFFINPKEEPKWFEYWKASRIEYYSTKLGIAPEHLRFHQHGKDELAHYAINAFDIEFLFPMGWQELEGIHSRSDYDLRRHQEFSGDKQEYLDQETQERFLPFVIETSAGLTRSVLMVLTDAYEEEVLGEGDVRTVLHFHPNLAPVKVAVMPVVKKDGLLEIAQQLELSLREDFATMLEPTGNIGKNYRRQDEIGTPYCVTVDHTTKEDNTVTIRFRDSMKQQRVPVAELANFIRNNMKNYVRGQ